MADEDVVQEGVIVLPPRKKVKYRISILQLFSELYVCVLAKIKAACVTLLNAWYKYSGAYSIITNLHMYSEPSIILTVII